MVQAVLDRRAGRALFRLLALFSLIGLPLTTQAADRAMMEPLGYSPDGRYFAFEQFGVQDGSGFAYAEIFLIDLDTDRFAGGSPFSARLDDDTAGIAAARQSVRDMAEDALDELSIDTPARWVAMSGDGEPDDERLALTYGVPGFGLADILDEHALSLDLFYAPTALPCMDWFGERPMGFALFKELEGERIEIHRDTRVPASRNCTVTYKFFGVLLPYEDFHNGSAVAILSVWSRGFEGYDRRFLALPVGDRIAP